MKQENKENKKLEMDLGICEKYLVHLTDTERLSGTFGDMLENPSHAFVAMLKTTDESMDKIELTSGKKSAFMLGYQIGLVTGVTLAAASKDPILESVMDGRPQNTH